VPPAPRLLDVHDSVLAVIDVQPGFVARLEPARRESFVARTAWLVAIAARLEVPVLATVEHAADHGGVVDAVAEHLPPGAPVVDKWAFGLTGDPVVFAALEALGRRTVVLVGMETDVCVAQSALGLLDAGLAPHVAADATESPRDAHAHGLERLRGAGVPLVSVKGVFTEWIRTPAACRRFEAAHPELFTGTPVLV
jgi:nicotinamidase-related amidase